MHLRFRRPSASMVIAFTALFLVLGGTGFAATTFNDTKQDTKLVRRLAKNLSVKHARFADIANFATTAMSAAAATNATNAANAINATTAANATDLGGQPASAYEPANKIVTSGGERFLSAGQTVTVAKIGHFTFTESCTGPASNPTSTFTVTSDVAGADLDGNQPATNTVTINSVGGGANGTAFAQSPSASDSTEIAPDGQEVDVFYNDGVNFNGASSTASQACFAGVTGFEG
jgi:hypothetical protein